MPVLIGASEPKFDDVNRTQQTICMWKTLHKAGEHVSCTSIKIINMYTKVIF